MMEYFYRIYGLRVQSQIPFSEAVPETAGEAEVKNCIRKDAGFPAGSGTEGLRDLDKRLCIGLVPHPGRNTGLCGRGQ